MRLFGRIRGRGGLRKEQNPPGLRFEQGERGAIGMAGAAATRRSAVFRVAAQQTAQCEYPAPRIEWRSGGHHGRCRRFRPRCGCRACCHGEAGNESQREPKACARDHGGFLITGAVALPAREGVDTESPVAVGKVYLVGAGPGDPGLLTLRGRECLARADVVLYDYLANEVLLDHAPETAERIFGGKHGAGPHFLEQDQINEILVERARRGLRIVRLKGGDPTVFGRGAEEADVLMRAGIPFEVVPGVTSALAVPALAGIPVTHRDWVSGVTVLTGHDARGKGASEVRWDLVAAAGNTIVLLMGLTRIRENLDRLIEHGLDPETPAAAIRWGSTPRQETITGTVRDLAAAVQRGGLRPPVVVVVGEVVGLRESIEWFEKRPLFGRRVLITRPRHQASALSRLLEEAGAEVLACPSIAIESLDPAPLHEAIGRLAEYTHLVLTSANGVDHFFTALDKAGLDMRALGGLRIAAIGPQTARRLAARHVRADIVPAEFRAEGLLAALEGEDLCNAKVLLPRAAGARAVLPDTLREAGALVDEIHTYRAVLPATAAADLAAILEDGPLDCVTFTSSSTASHFAQMLEGPSSLRDSLANTAVACIGPVTAETASEHGLAPSIQPGEYTVAALAAAVIDWFSEARKES